MPDTQQSDEFKSTLKRAASFCAFRERTIKDVQQKLSKWTDEQDWIEQIVAELGKQGFIDEERYARAFANDKFKFNKWGKRKIQEALRFKGITELDIQQGLESINISEYQSTLNELLTKKRNSLHEEDPFIQKQKVARFAIGKGFEPELVWKEIEELM